MGNTYITPTNFVEALRIIKEFKALFGVLIFLEVDKMDYNFLAEKYGTPLYVYDEERIRMNIDAYLASFKSNMFSTEVAYASKAFCVKELIRIISSYHMSLDVVSLGELFTAKAVDFDFSRIYFHGNNKSEEELMFAVRHNVGNIVVDNLEELKKLDLITKETKKDVSILIRLNSGIEAHTHKYIVTGHIDSKFGVLYKSLEYEEMIKLINDSKWIHFIGFHSHIGSQIFDLKAYEALIEKMVLICKDFSYPLVLNLGGGFGTRYVSSDHPVPLDEVGKKLVSKTEECLSKYQIKIDKLVIEPGRSIVAEAGSTVYKIGGIKKTPNKLYYFIDGGMTDNIRPALYQASYEADIVGKEKEFKNQLVTVAGKCCESGDLIIENILLPKASVGDLLVTYSTGAYGYSMSSNYNKALTPAVVFVSQNGSKLVCRRQTLEDLLEREI